MESATTEFQLHELVAHILGEPICADPTKYVIAPLFELTAISTNQFRTGRFWVGTSFGGLVLSGDQVVSLYSEIIRSRPSKCLSAVEPNAPIVQPSEDEFEQVASQIPLLKLNVIWPVSVFDAGKNPPLPLDTSILRLNWTSLNSAEVAELMKLIHENTAPPRKAQADAKMTIEINARPKGNDRRFYKFRAHFRVITSGEYGDVCTVVEPYQSSRHFNISYDPDRIEDPLGNPMTKLQMMQRVMGSDDIVLMDDVTSVLRLGPKALANAADYTKRDSTTIAHFLEVIERISRSSWYRSKFSMATTELKDGTSKQVSLQVPDLSAMLGALPFFRQLLSQDELFNSASNVYKRFCSTDVKQHWVEFYQKAFNKLRREEPKLPSIPMKNSEFLGIFFYGIKYFHSQSKAGAAEMELANLIAQYGRPSVVMSVNSCLLHSFGYGCQVYHVVKQDYDFWTASGAVGAEKLNLDELFSSYEESAGA